MSEKNVSEGSKKRYDALFKKALEKGLDFSILETLTRQEYNKIMKTNVKTNKSYEAQRSILIRMRDDSEAFNERMERLDSTNKRERNLKEHELRIEINKPFFEFTKPNMKYNTNMVKIPTSLPVARKRKEKYKFTNNIGQKNFDTLKFDSNGKKRKTGKVLNTSLVLDTFSDISTLIPILEKDASNIKKNIGLVFHYQWYDPKINKVGYDTFELQTGLTFSITTLLNRIYGRPNNDKKHNVDDPNCLFYKVNKGIGNLKTSIVIRFFKIDIDLMVYQ